MQFTAGLLEHPSWQSLSYHIKSSTTLKLPCCEEAQISQHHETLKLQADRDALSLVFQPPAIPAPATKCIGYLALELPSRAFPKFLTHRNQEKMITV